MMPPCARSACRAGPASGRIASTCARDADGQRTAWRDQDGAGIGIVFGLCEKIGGNPLSRAARGDDDDLGRAGVEIDAAIGGDERFCGCDVSIAWTHDLVDPRNRLRAVGERRNRVRPADAEHPRDLALRVPPP